MIPFNIPPYVSNSNEYIMQAIDAHKICGDGQFTKKCNSWMEDRFGAKKVLLTTSGTTALEMAALLCGIQTGDEVILPSYTFSSTANAFVLCGAKLVFVDIRPDTMNIDETKIEAAITNKTKAICVMHYAGVACEMDEIMAIAHRHDLPVIEDAAQGVMSTYKGNHLGTIGDFGCYSFHETKNYSMGEGGAIVINRSEIDIENAEIMREKGTDRSRFLRGQVDKYTWVAYGSSYLPSDLNAAYLWAQLERADEINDARIRAWNRYDSKLRKSGMEKYLNLPVIPEGCVHNAHMYWCKAKSLEERTSLIAFLKEKGVGAVFHYIPLHSAPAGLRYGRFDDKDVFTTTESERLLRLPMFYGIKDEEVDTVVEAIYKFYHK